MPPRALAPLLLSLLAAPASAGGFAPVADPPAPVAVPPLAAPAPDSDWSGPYLGAQLGFGRFDSALSDSDSDPLDFYAGDGPVVGLHAGYMLDLGRLVLGGELDWDRSSIAIGPGDDIPDTGNDFGSVESIARAKVRLGFDAGRFLPYVTAGVARVTFDHENPLITDFEDEGTGHFVGLGAAYAISDRFTVGVEALRHEFEDVPAPVDEPPPGVGFDTSFDTLTLRGSFSF